MKESRSDLFHMLPGVDIVGILTNGVVKRDGSLVMGRGVALEAAQRWPELPKKLGAYVKAFGNRPELLWLDDPILKRVVRVMSVPTKEHYREPSTIARVTLSLERVVRLMDVYHAESMALPRPGCGLGGLDWETQVKPICERLLDDRFTIVYR